MLNFLLRTHSTNQAIRREVKGTNERETTLYSLTFLQERKQRLHIFCSNKKALIQITGLSPVIAQGETSRIKEKRKIVLGVVHFRPRIDGRRLNARPPLRLRDRGNNSVRWQSCNFMWRSLRRPLKTRWTLDVDRLRFVYQTTDGAAYGGVVFCN